MVGLLQLSSGYVYQCEPGTDPTQCRMWNLEYDESAIQKHPERLPTVNISSTVRTIWLMFDHYYYTRHEMMTRYDVQLHSKILRDPSSVLLVDYQIKSIVIPESLSMGDFRNNFITEVETVPNRTYALQYLDLSHNNLRNVGNLTWLTQLKTLNLNRNRLNSVNPDTFSRMYDLQYLYLGDNSFFIVNLHHLPKTLTVLSLARNYLRKLTLSELSLPALRELDLENNQMTELDLAALFKAFPALELLPIEYNAFPQEDAQRIIAGLKLHNVSLIVGHVSGDNVRCDSDEYRVDNLCFSYPIMGFRSVWKAIVLLSLMVFAVIAFVQSVRWVWHQMRY
ncbi:uncharacterized protein LOC128731748 [Anopheles nili]|uniref:uncharacterized protein LOC128731748 n=1 Tax=Anopheles nili TaxID=185578 RepID=UPI00237B1431|nr:uncharacterized protein LOC128731748 [Anopheles nili]